LVVRYDARIGKGSRIFVARLKPGSDLLESLQDLVSKESIEAGVILSGVGLLGEARLRNCKSLTEEFPITDVNRSFVSFKRPLEILSISGNISKADGEPLVHAHICLSCVEGDVITVVGGHLLGGCVVYGFAEIVVMELDDIEMVKRFDEETKTLQLFA